MKDLLTAAIRQAETSLAPAPGGPQRLCLAYPGAPFGWRRSGRRQAEVCAQTLAASVDLTGTWFSEAVPAGGYLNLVFATEWCDAAAREPAQVGDAGDRPVPPIPDFPAEIFAYDWRPAAPKKKLPAPNWPLGRTLGNPAWLVRCHGGAAAKTGGTGCPCVPGVDGGGAGAAAVGGGVCPAAGAGHAGAAVPLSGGACSAGVAGALLCGRRGGAVRVGAGGRVCGAVPGLIYRIFTQQGGQML